MHDSCSDLLHGWKGGPSPCKSWKPYNERLHVPVPLTMAQTRQTGPLCEVWWYRHVINICCSSFTKMFAEKSFLQLKTANVKEITPHHGTVLNLGQFLALRKIHFYLKLSYSPLLKRLNLSKWWSVFKLILRRSAPWWNQKYIIVLQELSICRHL